MRHFEPETLKTTLTPLPKWKQTAFLVGISERLLPNYNVFALRHGLQATALRLLLDEAWRMLEANSLDVDASELSETCIKYAPDTEDFDDPLVSAALDAATVASMVFDFITNTDLQVLVDGASIAIDTVTMYVSAQEHMQSGLEVDGEDSPVTQRELERQQDDLSFLASIPNGSATVDVVETLKQRWYGLQVGSLNLGPSQ